MLSMLTFHAIFKVGEIALYSESGYFMYESNKNSSNFLLQYHVTYGFLSSASQKLLEKITARLVHASLFNAKIVKNLFS